MKRLLVALTLVALLISVVAVPAFAYKGSDNGAYRMPTLSPEGTYTGVVSAVDYGYYTVHDGKLWHNVIVLTFFMSSGNVIGYVEYSLSPPSVQHGVPVSITIDGLGKITEITY